GRPEVVANSANQPVWRAKNYAFHREVMQQGGSFGALNLGFPGQYYDAETNLYYNWHRYYDPSTGRYTQADPIGLAGGVNTYGYAVSRPTAFVDPNGLQVIDPITGVEVGRFIVDSRGNTIVEPVGGKTIPYPPFKLDSPDTHTCYANGSNAYRLNPQGHANNPQPHGHAHLPGTGPARRGQGVSLNVRGQVVPPNSPGAHIPLRSTLGAYGAIGVFQMIFHEYVNSRVCAADPCACGPCA
ncbi:RHS repeat-associated core domain-containing protein, partial [Pseudomarimonas arenosa]